MRRSQLVLPIIVLAQFCCTSLWFAGNGVMEDLAAAFDLSASALPHLTSAVQFGFISGTLVFAFLTIADRFSPSQVFFASALAGALSNLGMMYEGGSLGSLLLFRFLTGFFLAGIYPVGMKIAADHFQAGLGRSLGFLVGALVVGTAFPHLLKSLDLSIAWQGVLVATSVMAVLGGVLIVWLVGDGPYRKASIQMDLTALVKVFANKNFRSAAFGYFGHMWELYAFWAFVPLMMAQFVGSDLTAPSAISLGAFIVIGLGGLSCAAAGVLSQRLGTQRLATWALGASCLCCLLSPLVFSQRSGPLTMCFLVFWGLVVIADSPLFSTLVARNAMAEARGTALTIVNCLGFAITIVSIQIVGWLALRMEVRYLFLILAVGPLLGIWALVRGGQASDAAVKNEASS